MAIRGESIRVGTSGKGAIDFAFIRLDLKKKTEKKKMQQKAKKWLGKIKIV